MTTPTPAPLCVVGGQVQDPVAAPVLTGVLEAVLATYDALPEESTIQGPCAAGIVAGAAAALDRGLDCADGCLGMLWVRLVNVFPSRQFPAADVTPAPGPLSWAVIVEVGVVRPAPVMEDAAGELIIPSMEEEQAAAALAVTDAAILRSALLTQYADAEDVSIVLGVWTPLGPDGGVVGGAVTATIQVT